MMVNRPVIREQAAVSKNSRAKPTAGHLQMDIIYIS